MTFGGGGMGEFLGTPEGADATRFKPMALPEGIYLTQIESYLQSAYGID